MADNAQYKLINPKFTCGMAVISDCKFIMDKSLFMAELVTATDSVQCYFEAYQNKVQNLHWRMPISKSLKFGKSELLRIHNRYYYAFGAPLYGRKYVSQAGSYRYGFNGKENDNEVKGAGNSLDFGARIYDSRLGKWLSMDPLQAKYPDLSPYNFCDNNPILLLDPDGRVIVNSNDPNVLELKAIICKTTFGRILWGQLENSPTHFPINVVKDKMFWTKLYENSNIYVPNGGKTVATGPYMMSKTGEGVGYGYYTTASITVSMALLDLLILKDANPMMTYDEIIKEYMCQIQNVLVDDMDQKLPDFFVVAIGYSGGTPLPCSYWEYVTALLGEELSHGANMNNITRSEAGKGKGVYNTLDDIPLKDNVIKNEKSLKDRAAKVSQRVETKGQLDVSKMLEQLGKFIENLPRALPPAAPAGGQDNVPSY